MKKVKPERVYSLLSILKGGGKLTQATFEHNTLHTVSTQMKTTINKY